MSRSFLMTVNEACEKFNLRFGTIYQAIQRGGIDYTMKNGEFILPDNISKSKFLKSDLEARNGFQKKLKHYKTLLKMNHTEFAVLLETPIDTTRKWIQGGACPNRDKQDLIFGILRKASGEVR
jgi:DNA-binding transcriptional regulator YiaG